MVLNSVLRLCWRAFLIVAAVAVGLVTGFVITDLTFQNQFQQLRTARGFAILALVLGGLCVFGKKFVWSKDIEDKNR